MLRLVIKGSLPTLLAVLLGGWTHGVVGSLPNANSPIGTNLIEPTADGMTPDNPFLNSFKLGGGWITGTSGSNDTGDETILYAHCVDSNNYLNVSPASCTGSFGGTFTLLRTVIFADQSPYNYPAGNYVFMWDGNTNATFTFNARDSTTATSCAVTGHPNRILVASASPTSGIEIRETSIGTGGSYPTNIRFINATAVLAGDVASDCSTIGTREALMNSGEIFDPQFISIVKNYRAVRFMKWSDILYNTLVNWSDRSLQSWVFWNEGQYYATALASGVQLPGIPYEVEIALCNEIHADCWLNSPFLASDSLMTSLATLALNNLNAPLRVYEEPGNEWWLQGTQSGAAVVIAGASNGNALYPCTGNANPTDPCGSPNPGTTFQKFFDYGAYQFARAATDWKAVWTGGNAARLTTVLGGNYSFTSRNQFLLDFQDSFFGGTGTHFSGTVASHVDAGTTAPYFPNINWFGGCPRAWTADGDGGIGRCTTEYTTGGNLTTGTTVTTTHTTSSANACSVATGLSANHYSATVSGATLTNGLAINITFDTPIIGPCDDLNVNGLGAALLVQDQETFVQDQGAGAPAGISGTTLTVTNNSNLPACCGPTIVPGGEVVLSGVSAGTFIEFPLSGPLQDTITASIASTKVMTVTATAATNVQITYVIVGGTVAPGTVVTGNSSSGATACNGSPCTGAGGTGTYAVSIGQTVTSTAGLSAESTEYSGTYKVNNSQTVTCNPCAVTNPLATGTSGGPNLMVYTNATSAGSMPSSWRDVCNGGGCLEQSGGWVAGTLALWTGDINLFTQAPYNLKFIGYEGGMSAASCCRSDELATLMAALYQNGGTIQTSFLNGLRGAGLNGIFAHFTLTYAIQSTGLGFGVLESSRETSSSRNTATQSYISNTPCWWSNCALPYLLNRDLNPSSPSGYGRTSPASNDNSPVWLNKVA